MERRTNLIRSPRKSALPTRDLRKTKPPQSPKPVKGERTSPRRPTWAVVVVVLLGVLCLCIIVRCASLMRMPKSRLSRRRGGSRSSTTGVLSSIIPNKFDLGILTATTAPTLPKCVFPTIKPEDIPTQLRDEYTLVQDFEYTPRGAVALYKTQPRGVEGACVNNPLMQRLTARGATIPMACMFDPRLILGTDPKRLMRTVRLPECVPMTPSEGTIDQLLEDPLWVLSMKPPGTTLAEASFEEAGFKPVVVPGVNGREATKHCDMGEWPAGVYGIRLSFRKLIMRALNEGHERVIIAEDDVVLADDFSAKLDSFIKTERCGGFMFDDSTGGVLLLGASDYGGVAMIKAGTNNIPRTKCYNVNGRTYGAFAAVYHRNVLLPILAWLDSPQFASLPMDHIWKHLAIRGFTVRVLKPMLALADVLHHSSTGLTKRTFVDKLDTSFILWRSCRMHWDLAAFEYYRTELASRSLFDLNRRKYCFRTKYSLTNYSVTQSAVVMIHAPANLDTLSRLADVLVARWRAKLDGRYEGFIARPFIVVEAPRGLPAMTEDEVRGVVRGMRTQSFETYQDRVGKAMEYAGDGSLDLADTVSKVVRKLASEAYAPILVLSAEQAEELKEILFSEPFAQMYFELRAKSPWVPTAAQMVPLVKATKPRGRHWYSLNVDPALFAVDDSESGADDDDGGDPDLSAAVDPLLVPVLQTSASDDAAATTTAAAVTAAAPPPTRGKRKRRRSWSGLRKVFPKFNKGAKLWP
jgi:hypothetical protein